MYRSSFTTTLTGVLLSLLALLAPGLCRAQEAGQDMFYVANGQFARLDPTRSAELPLLQREEVQAELVLNSRQREKLNDFTLTAWNDLTERIHAASHVDPGVWMLLSPEQRKRRAQEMEVRRQAAFVEWQSGIDSRLGGVLSRSQITRLRQLDLQWRGPLAIATPAVASALKLTPAQASRVSQIERAYVEAAQAVMGRAVGDIRELARPKAGRARPTHAQLQAAVAERVKAAQPDIERARASGAAKVMAVLTPRQRSAWSSLVGLPFAFVAMTGQADASAEGR